MIHATHVHESADLVGGWGPDNFTSGVNPYYQDQMRHHIASAVKQAMAGLKPARVTMSSIAVQDADRDMKRYVSDVRDPVVIENTLHTLQFTDISDEKNPKVLTTLVNWAHHPESEGSRNHLISSDWVHYLRRELYAQVQSNPAIFDFLQAGSLDGLWYWDLEHPEHEWISPRLWQVLGQDPATRRHLASEWQELIFPEDLALAIDNFRRHCADPAHPYDQIVRYRHADGSTVWIRCRGVAIRDAAGRPRATGGCR